MGNIPTCCYKEESKNNKEIIVPQDKISVSSNYESINSVEKKEEENFDDTGLM